MKMKGHKEHVHIHLLGAKTMDIILRWFKYISLYVPKGSSGLFKMQASRFSTKWFIILTSYRDFIRNWKSFTTGFLERKGHILCPKYISTATVEWADSGWLGTGQWTWLLQSDVKYSRPGRIWKMHKRKRELVLNQC